MVASEQPLPNEYKLHPGVVLYAALNMEELAESLTGLRNALAKKAEAGSPLGEIEAILLDTVLCMQSNSLAIRGLVEKLPKDLVVPVDREDLREMADGATDLMVTNAGFALSLGLPGPVLYTEVVGSNLSKKNPDTGKIDKLPDGKWIKGRNYVKPDIDKILFPAEA